LHNTASQLSVTADWLIQVTRWADEIQPDMLRTQCPTLPVITSSKVLSLSSLAAAVTTPLLATHHHPLLRQGSYDGAEAQLRGSLGHHRHLPGLRPTPTVPLHTSSTVAAAQGCEPSTTHPSRPQHKGAGHGHASISPIRSHWTIRATGRSTRVRALNTLHIWPSAKNELPPNADIWLALFTPAHLYMGRF